MVDYLTEKVRVSRWFMWLGVITITSGCIEGFIQTVKWIM